MNRILIAFTSILIVALVAGCSVAQKLWPPTPAAQPGDVLFFDDFSDTESGWGSWNADGSAVAYHSGGLRILVGKPQTSFWSLPGRSFTDAVVAVDTLRMTGPANNSYGILCRYLDDANMLGGIISNDQYAGIIRVKDGQVAILSDNGMLTYQPNIQVEGGNHLELRCDGSTIAFWVNGMRIAIWNDGTVLEGQVGVIASSLGEPGVDILFDNFTVSQP